MELGCPDMAAVATLTAEGARSTKRGAEMTREEGLGHAAAQSHGRLGQLDREAPLPYNGGSELEVGDDPDEWVLPGRDKERGAARAGFCCCWAELLVRERAAGPGGESGCGCGCG